MNAIASAPSRVAAQRTAALKVYAPASIGNVSVGFDALGLALAPLDGTLLGDTVQVLPGVKPDWKLSVTGPFAERLPADPEQNIVLQCCRLYQRTSAERGVKIQPLELVLDKRLPIGSGLGSSASSVVATLEVLNRWHGHPLSSRELFRLMASAEGRISGEVHLDNVAPCLHGGLRLCPPGSQSEFGLPWPARWRAVVCWPGTELVTREARAVLPEVVPRGTAVRHGAQFAQFIHALYTGNTRLAAESMIDLIAEPHRRSLLPGFEEAREALTGLGALTVGISGSGPTIFALADDTVIANRVGEWLNAHYRQTEQGFTHVCRADLGGARSIA